MNVEQALAFVVSLNMLFVNKVITRAEFRAKLAQVYLYTGLCKAESKSKKVTRK